MVNVDELKLLEDGAVEMLAEVWEEIESLRVQLANTNNRIEELEYEVFPPKPEIKDSGGWSAW